ncbi:HAMP domain-containing sensor histidine kinase [Nonomuraea sp. NPDC004580]|uniref:sensor histidine kinase n=1 Tax=Nonomuraea sp. NPDC004580 TaxID=3154552 RepID=UPI0033AB4D01
MIARLRGLSLRARLLAITVLLLVAGLAMIGSVLVRQLETQLTARVDAQLAPMGAAMSAVPPELATALSARAGDTPMVLTDLDLVSRIHAAYLAPDGRVLRAFGESGIDLPRLDTADIAQRGGRPFTVRDADGSEWRAVALPARRTSAEVGHTGVVAAVSLDGLHSTVDRMWVVCFVAGGILLAVLALVGGLAIRAGLAPLRRVEETAAAIAGGDLSRRVPSPGPATTEVGRLARSINAMLAQIEQGVTARVGSEARMRRFVADVSHELRTPLFGIKGFSELYRMGGTEAGPALARIESESGRLAKLVDDLLLLAGLDEDDGPGLELTPMDLRTLAADARHDLTALDPTRPITFTGPSSGPSSGPAGTAPVLGDEARLRQVVSNLVGNAITHTPTGTPVRIGVGTEGGESVLIIEDEGPGLTPEEAARAFDRFYRADASRARATGGAGLGLAIVRSIITAHGGHVDLRTAPGQGATFRIRLPAHEDRPP